MKTVWSQIRSAFVSGLFLLAPLAVTVWIVLELVHLLGKPVHQLLEAIPKEWQVPEIFLDIVAAIIAAIIITLVGVISERFASKFFWSWMEGFLNRVPLVKSVYGTVKQIVETFSQGNRAVFQQVVLVRFPHQESWTVGFLTGDVALAIREVTGPGYVNVFVPTTPNPTAGFLLLVPRDAVKPLSLSVSDGMKLIISGGTVTPESTPEKN